ncbi:MAG: SGNH/GDSL hydrolase family protein [Eubacteriales bacterium]|nr:SGNH/GDSL hydrolase family protein [Eubacteriales bacterium]
MKIQEKQLREIVHGAERVTEEKNGFRFHRFTEEQEEYYRENSPEDFYLKALATSGISLAFKTDSRTLRISINNTIASSRRFAFLDIEADKEIISHIGSDEKGIGEFAGTVDLGEGIKRVCIYFPQLVSATLKELELDDGSLLEPIPMSRKMLLFGDSITQGYDALYPSHTYATGLAGLLNADARNKGIGGEVFQPALALKADSDFEPDIITVAYGTNDFTRRSSDVLREKAYAFYRNISETYPTAKIFAISPIWRGDKSRVKKCEKPFEWVSECIEGIARQFQNVIFIDGINLVPHDPACYSPDGLHPNDIGFATYTERLYASVKPYL